MSGVCLCVFYFKKLNTKVTQVTVVSWYLKCEFLFGEREGEREFDFEY